MTDPKLLDAFNNCIDMMAEGQSVDACLARYPEYASQLRTLLQAGQITNTARIPASEVLQAKARVDATVLAAIEQLPAPGLSAPSATSSMTTPLAAAAVVVLVIGVGIIALVASGRNHFAVTPLPEETLTMMPIMTDTPTQTATLTPTVTATDTPTHTATFTPTITATDTPTYTATFTPTMTPTEAETVMVIEGPITAINDDALFIYTFEIPLPQGFISDLQIGDFVRVEIGDDTVTLIQEPQSDATEESENAGSNNGQATAPGQTTDPVEVWRDDGTCKNPPPDWAPASGWRERCGDENNLPPGRQDNNRGQNPPENQSGNNQNNGQNSSSGQNNPNNPANPPDNPQNNQGRGRN